MGAPKSQRKGWLRSEGRPNSNIRDNRCRKLTEPQRGSSLQILHQPIVRTNHADLSFSQLQPQGTICAFRVTKRFCFVFDRYIIAVTVDGCCVLREAETLQPNASSGVFLAESQGKDWLRLKEGPNSSIRFIRPQGCSEQMLH
jgi:hypothetical protein